MILDIDLVSDFVCPWCFLGKVRLDRALAELRVSRPDLDVRVNWLPFFLNPDTPAAGEPYREFLEAKFGGPIKAEAVLDKVRAVAADDGLVYAFERIQTRPNTLAAHRLMYRAQAHGQKPERIQALAHALFAARASAASWLACCAASEWPVPSRAPPRSLTTTFAPRRASSSA